MRRYVDTPTFDAILTKLDLVLVDYLHQAAPQAVASRKLCPNSCSYVDVSAAWTRANFDAL